MSISTEELFGMMMKTFCSSIRLNSAKEVINFLTREESMKSEFKNFLVTNCGDHPRVESYPWNLIPELPGAKDCQGNSIFEGSIVLCIEDNETGVVKYSTEFARFFIEWNSGLKSCFGTRAYEAEYKYSDVKVIGHLTQANFKVLGITTEEKLLIANILGHTALDEIDEDQQLEFNRMISAIIQTRLRGLDK